MRTGDFTFALLLGFAIAPTTYGQIDFSKAIEYEGDVAQTQSVEELPAVRPLDSSPPIQHVAPETTPVVHHPATPAGVAAPTHLDMTQAVQVEADCNCHQHPIACDPCQCEDDGSCFFRKNRPPMMIQSDPMMMSTFPSVYQTPECLRGFWATYPAEKARQCRKLRRCMAPPPHQQCETEVCEPCQSAPVHYVHP